MLREDYKDDVLDTSVNILRKYADVRNGDDTVTLIDKSIYAQVGDEFGSEDANATNKQVNLNTRAINVIKEIVDDNRYSQPVLVETTAFAASWIGTEPPFICEIPVEQVTTTNNVLVCTSPILNVRQANEWMNAGVISGSQKEGKIYLKGYGEKPILDIPILVFVTPEGDGERPPEEETCSCEEITDKEIMDIVGSCIPAGRFIEPATNEEIKEVIEGE